MVVSKDYIRVRSGHQPNSPWGARVLAANVVVSTPNEEPVQSIFPVFFVAIVPTTAFHPEPFTGSDLFVALVHFDPRRVRHPPLAGLMLTGYDGSGILLALGVTAAVLVLGAGVMYWN